MWPLALKLLTVCLLFRNSYLRHVLMHHKNKQCHNDKLMEFDVDLTGIEEYYATFLTIGCY
jgi:hypothetical protein